MSGTEYLNINLTIGQEDDDYQAELDCPTGKSTTIFKLKFSDQELNSLLARIRKPGPGARGSSSVEAQTAKDFGIALFNSAFDKESLSTLRECVAKAADMDCGLRVRLIGCSEVVDLPWEYLYDKEQRRYVFDSPDYLLMRHCNTHISREILPLTIKSNLRVLVMMPDENSTDGAQTEWDMLNNALSSQEQVTLERLEPPTFRDLKARLSRAQGEESIHVFHFSGQIGFDEISEEAVLMIRDDRGENEMVTVGALGYELYKHQPLRLAVLIGRNQTEGEPGNAFSSAARSLLQQRVSSAVTTQLEMSPVAAAAFAGAFYTTLAAARPVDAALAEARNAVAIRAGLVQSGAPVLYTRVLNGKLFSKEEAVPGGPAVLKSKTSPPDEDDIDGHFDMIAEAIKKGRVIPFLGAGASQCGRPMNSEWDPAKRDFLPNSRQLSAHLVKQLYPRMPQETQGDLLRTSQYISIEVGEMPLYEELHSIFALPYEPTPLHNLLAEIPSILKRKGYAPMNQLVLTTNYDNLMERAFVKAGVECDLIYYESKNEDMHFGKLCKRMPDGTVNLIAGENGYQDISLDCRSVVIKIHGAVQEIPDHDSYVITEDDYIDYLTHTEISKFFPVKLAKKIKKSHFLFLGYKLRDWNMRAILRQIELAQTLPVKSWAIQNDAEPIDTVMWRNRGVKILNMDLQTYVDRLSEVLRAMPRAGDD